MASVLLVAPPGVTGTIDGGPGRQYAIGANGAVSVDPAAVTALLADGFTYPASLKPAALTGTIYVDPQNSTGQATHAGSVYTGPSGIGTLFLLYADVVGVWGTFSPRLRADTAVIFLSSHTDNGDPVQFYPTVENGAVASIQGGPPKVLAQGVVLSGKVAKGRAAGSNALLQFNLGANGAAGILVDNLTHPSRAWSFKSLGSNNFSMTQPMGRYAIPCGSVFKSEVDTWANGDIVNLLQPISVNIVAVGALIADFNGTFDNRLYLYQLNKPSFAGLSQNCFVGDCRILECSSQKMLVGDGAKAFNSETAIAICNCYNAGGITGACAWFLLGGMTGGLQENWIACWAGSGTDAFIGIVIDADHILSGAAPFILPVGAQAGFVYLDTPLHVQSGNLIIEASTYGGAAIYGSAGNNVVMQGSSHLYLASGTFSAALTAPALVSPGIQLNGASTASSHTGASPDVLNSGITTTPAHLDAAAGVAGFGGNAFNLGGASVSNFA